MSKKLLANVGNAVADNYRRYYQEYEGTFITATDKSEDDTIDTSRFIEVTEIWGNTVQDENNLEDIQSIGELYVDEEGEPILDDLGREQYKIEIESCNENLSNMNYVVGYINAQGQPLTGGTYDGFRTSDFIKVKKDFTYYFKNFTSLNGVCGRNARLLEFDKNKQPLGNPIRLGTYQYTPVNGCEYIKLSFDCRYNDGGNMEVNPPLDTDFRFSISLSNLTEYILPQSHKTTILLPCQLQKVGNVYDRLYWDSEKEKYVVEKNVKHGLLKEIPFSKYTYNQSLRPSYTQFMYRDTVNILPSSSKFITNIQQKTITDSTLGEGLYYEAVWNGYTIRISILTENLITNDVNGLNLYLDNSVYYMNNIQMQIIETNITEKILLPCYEEKTHIFVNSTVDATMKVLVPYKEII